MSNKIETVEFWEQVKREYKNAAQHLPHFICDRSETFSVVFLYGENESLVKIAAKEFLSGAGESVNKLFSIGGPALFIANDYNTSVLERICIRLDFIDYMIEKTKNNLQSPN